MRNSLDTESWATTLELVRIRNMTFSRVSPRRSIEKSPHMDFSLSPASINAEWSSSGSTSYFAEMKARYSFVDAAFLPKFSHSFPALQKSHPTCCTTLHVRC